MSACGCGRHNLPMFRRRLSIALALLALATALQGAAAVWALGVADRHVRHGRVTSDIHRGFVELSATKQRLRTWVSQAQQGAGADPVERDRLEGELQLKLEQLRGLSEQALRMGTNLDADDRLAQQRRLETLDLLGRSFAKLARAIDSVQPLPPGADARQAWNALTRVFEESEGQNLRELIGEGMTRAGASVARERAAADRTLKWTRTLWAGTAAALSLAALLLAWHFARALRRPLAQLATGAAALQRGELGHRIAEGPRDEFAVVARSMNAMAAELQQHRDREAAARQELQGLVDERTRELRLALSSLQEADERRRRLFADISHELRTPTTAIRGEAEVALRGPARPVDDYRSTLQRIVETSSQLGLVIDDLLTMARSDIDALALHRAPIDPTVPVGEALVQIAGAARERDTMLQMPNHWPAGLSVLGDAQRLRQLVLILLDNAVRYSHPGGTVRVRLQAAGDASGPPHFELTVADEGIGIASEDLPHIFERHYRGREARLHRADGTGLGLAIAMALARAHGGSLRVDSEPGHGTTMHLRLPLLSQPALLVSAA
jgi:two-component system, OmpR family, sensor kinase